MKWRRWSDLSQLERVDLYARQSLLLMLWVLNGYVLFTAATAPDLSAAHTVAVVAGSVVVTACGARVIRSVFEQYPTTRPLPWRRVIPLLAAGAVYLATVAPEAPETVRGVMVTIVVFNLVWTLGGLPDNRLSGTLVAISGLLFGVVGSAVTSVAAGIALGAILVTTARASLWLFKIVTELDTARQAQAQLAVAEERLRFSRDVHDVLGQRLATIAVQSELAATLAERNDERAIAQMLEVRGVAHETVREARELARGYRPTDLATELAGARSLLDSAGIEVRLDVTDVPRAWHEAAGWVVREAVTNVLRHSAASSVTISYAGHELRIVNDGIELDLSSGSRSRTPAVDTSGLQGLRERLEPLGASLTVQTDNDLWAVVARLAGSGPLSSTRTTTTDTDTATAPTTASQAGS